MKTKYFPLLFCAAMLLLYTYVNSQVLKGIGDKIKKTAQKDTKKKDTDVDTTRRPEARQKLIVMINQKPVARL